MRLPVSLLVVEGDAEIIEVEGDDMFLTDVGFPVIVKFSSDNKRRRETLSPLPLHRGRAGGQLKSPYAGGFRGSNYLALPAPSFQMCLHDGGKGADDADSRCLRIVGDTEEQLRELQQETTGAVEFRLQFRILGIRPPFVDDLTDKGVVGRRLNTEAGAVADALEED